MGIMTCAKVAAHPTLLPLCLSKLLISACNMPASTIHTCLNPKCLKQYHSKAQLKRHRAHSRKCREAWEAQLAAQPRQILDVHSPQGQADTYDMSNQTKQQSCLANRQESKMHLMKKTNQMEPHLSNHTQATQDKIYGPFADMQEWELAEWLFKNCTQSAADQYLHCGAPVDM